MCAWDIDVTRTGGDRNWEWYASYTKPDHTKGTHLGGYMHFEGTKGKAGTKM